MSPVWSGGIIYQYFAQTMNQDSDFQYGLVLDNYRYAVTAEAIIKASVYQNVLRHLATVSPSSINSEEYIPTNTAAACPVGAALSLPPNPVVASSAVIPPRTTIPVYISTNGSIIASNNTLSTGGKVGIGIGLAFLLLALALGNFLIHKRAKGKKRVDQEQDQSGQWTRTELTADDIDREARGYGPHMAASTQRAEVDGSGVMGKVQADSSEIFEAPGDLPTLPELSGTSRRGDSLMQNNKF